LTIANDKGEPRELAGELYFAAIDPDLVTPWVSPVSVHLIGNKGAAMRKAEELQKAWQAAEHTDQSV